MGGHASTPITPNSELPEEVKGVFKDDAHEKIGNTKSLLPMENLRDLLSYMNKERDQSRDLSSQLDAQQGINASVFWALYNLHGEIEKTRKEILMHRIDALQIKIQQVNEEIGKAEKSGSGVGDVIHSAAKTIVNHVKGLFETMVGLAETTIGVATGTPVLTGLGCVSLGLTTIEDVKDLIEKLTAKGEAGSERSSLKKELSKLEENMAKNKGKLRKKKNDGN